MEDLGRIVGFYVNDAAVFCSHCAGADVRADEGDEVLPIHERDYERYPLFCDGCGDYIPTRLIYPVEVVQDLLDSGVPDEQVRAVAEHHDVGVFLVLCDGYRLYTSDPVRALVRFGVFDIEHDAEAALDEAGDALFDGVDIEGIRALDAYVERLY